VKPAVNEELAATAVAGSQQIAQTVGAKVDGVFALWYGKGPGLDRASDAIRHGNFQGSSPLGGVVLAVGDDHIAKSSSIICYSDDVLAGLQIPLLYPANAAEIIEFGLHAFALSRHTGSWTALKIITEVADATHSATVDEMSLSPILPPIDAPLMGLHNRWPESPLQQELRQQNFRLPAIRAYVRANDLDRVHLRRPSSRIGLVAAGKSWLDLREALRLLELDDLQLVEFGIALYKPAMTWPLEPEGLREFADGLEMLIIVEEKGPFIENQVKALLYGSKRTPIVCGKTLPSGQPLFAATGDLTPEQIAGDLGGFLSVAATNERLTHAVRRIQEALRCQRSFAVPPMIRKPFFCSGCPHNRSTEVPEGSRALAGIGCHGLAAYNRPRTASFSQMGGEGIQWMGLAPFTDETHIFANMGDGTYFHSGLLAIRQAVAANLNITYKLLYNSAVAMTGGQSVDGELSVLSVVRQLRAEGVKTVAVATDDLDRYPRADPVRKLVTRIEHRDDLEELQRDLCKTSGVSVIVYEQMCANEKRRLRKRGKLADPVSRVFINELVCEGCGDCSVKSNCLSIEPTTTIYGTKRRINQSSCNKDYSCLTGFCPSFVTLEGAIPRRNRASLAGQRPSLLPEPARPVVAHQRMVVAGIGGTGVVTIGALLAMAAHSGGQRCSVLDQVGMAQKGGAVTSHIHILDGDSESADNTVNALRIPPGEADLVIACDQIVGNAPDVIGAITPRRTRVLLNSDVQVTGDFTQNRHAQPDASLLTGRLADRAGADFFLAYPFTRLAEGLFGDTIASNLMMVGAAYQKGWIGINREDLQRAIELNGQSVAMNTAAFDWGRRLVTEPAAVNAAAGLTDQAPETLDTLIKSRAAFLAAYQDSAYAERFQARIAAVRKAEEAITHSTLLTEKAARALFKLMAYKDEYEVARLFADGAFVKAVGEQFEGNPKLFFHMAPPILARRDPATGQLRKRRFGPWMMIFFRVLARLRFLRGTRFDFFAYTDERKAERALIAEYDALLESLTATMSLETLNHAVAIAALPLEIKGYGHVKDKAIADYRAALKTMTESKPLEVSGHDMCLGEQP
jgi:indolepyruvate ferredoxin oxidoreductase